MREPLQWYDDNADNPPWIKALAEVRRLAPREGWCYHHVQAIIGNRAGLIRALESLGFTNLAGVTALAAAGKPLGSGGDRIDVYQLDVGLKKFQVGVDRRMQFKTALIREGLL